MVEASLGTSSWEEVHASYEVELDHLEEVQL